MRVECSACNAHLKVPNTASGKRGKCPKCGEVIEIPESTAASGPPATQKQKDYASSLGIEFPPDITKADISALISKALEKKDEQRYKKLDELQEREGEAYQGIREEILAEIEEEGGCLSQASHGDMVEELKKRNEGAIFVSFPMTGIDFENLAGTNFQVSFSDNLSEVQMRALLAALGSMAAGKGDR
jgi:phage FluMu protein Com